MINPKVESNSDNNLNSNDISEYDHSSSKNLYDKIK